MKKVSMLLVLSLAFAAVVFAQTVPADKQVINLKEAWAVEGKQKAVMFKHDTHSKNLTCDSCHSTPEGGNKFKPEGNIKGTNDKNAAHKLCWDCHKTQKPDPVKKTCKTCHDGPK